MNEADWKSALLVLACVLRPPSGPDPEMSVTQDWVSAIEQARGADDRFGELGEQIADLVFDGYQDWYIYDRGWILTSLGQFLDEQGAQEGRLLSLLERIAGPEDRQAALSEFLEYAETCVAAWKEAARNQQYAGGLLPGVEQTVPAWENTESWSYSRTPGTFYYKYVDGKYFYSDTADAEDDEWHDLAFWDNKAEAACTVENAMTTLGYGTDWSGWYAIPTTDGTGRVYGTLSEGRWMTWEQALAVHEAGEEPVTAGWGRQRAHSIADQVPVADAQEERATADPVAQSQFEYLFSRIEARLSEDVKRDMSLLERRRQVLRLLGEAQV